MIRVYAVVCLEGHEVSTFSGTSWFSSWQDNQEIRAAGEAIQQAVNRAAAAGYNPMENGVEVKVLFSRKE